MNVQTYLDRINTLSDMRFIATEEGDRRELAVENQEEYAEILRRHFGIVMK